MSQVPPQPPPGLAQPGTPAPAIPGGGAVPAARASFWQRLVAGIADGILLNVVTGIVAALLGSPSSFTEPSPAASGIQLLLGFAYYVYFHGSPSGQTLGKKAMKIRVMGAEDGNPIGYGRAALRWVGSILSALPLLLGYFWMLWDDNKQTWHDKIATSVVVPESDAPVAKWPG